MLSPSVQNISLVQAAPIKNSFHLPFFVTVSFSPDNLWNSKYVFFRIGWQLLIEILYIFGQCSVNMFLQWNPIVVLGFQVSIQRFSIFSDNAQINMFLQVSIEILCIAFLLFRLAQEFLFSVKGAFWRCPRKPPELLFWVLLFTTRDAKHVVQLTVLVLMFLDIAIYTGLYESDVSSVRFELEIKSKYVFKTCHLRSFLTLHQNQNPHQMVAPPEASSPCEHPRGSSNQKGIQEYKKVPHFFSLLVKVTRNVFHR